MDYHDRELLGVLLRAGAVLLPADYSVIDTMDKREDIGRDECASDSGWLPSDVAALVQYQLLILAQQRLAFVWSVQRLHDAMADSDVLDAIGQHLQHSRLRPGWLGRESARLLALNDSWTKHIDD